MKKAIEQEKFDKAERKRVEREAALKVIKANEEYRHKLGLQQEQEKIKNQSMLANEEAAAIKEE